MYALNLTHSPEKGLFWRVPIRGKIIVTGSIGVGELMSGEVEESFILRVSNYTLEAKKRGKDQIFYE